MVIMVHTSQYFGCVGIDNVDRALGCGMYGVQLFFVASAFTLFLSYKNRMKKEKLYKSNFFIRRFFRIAPLYYLGLVYYFFIQGGHRVSSFTNFAEIVANVFFVNDFYPEWINHIVPGGWSVAVEMTFYLVLPILFARIKNIRQAVNALLVAIAANAILRQIMLLIPVDIQPGWIYTEFLYYWFPSQLPVFLMGIILYFLVVEKNTLKEVSPWAFAILAVALVANKMFDLHLFLFDNVIFAFFFLVFAYALSEKPIKIFVNPITQYIGKISFSMYLVHFAIMFWLEKFGCIPSFSVHPILNYTMWYLLVVTITVAISTITYYCVEQPFQNLGKRLIRNRESKLSMVEIK